MFFRKHKRVVKDCGDELITEQHHKDKCDIYNILQQYSATGIFSHVNAMHAEGRFEHLPDRMDYQEALIVLDRAQETFDDLPASVRDAFQNNPALFLGAFRDPAQADRLRELGLLNSKAADPPASSPEPPKPVSSPETK